MLDLHPRLLESLNGAVAHILTRKDEKPEPQELEMLVDHLFSGLVEGADRQGADWSMTWGHLIQCFWEDGASLYEATQLAMDHFVGIVMEVCDDISQGVHDAEVDSLDKLKIYIRWTIDRVVEEDLASEGTQL